VALPPEVHAYAERQHGLVLATQIRTAGLSRSAERHAVAADRLQRVTTRVLRVPGTPPTEHQRVLAGVLDAAPASAACGSTGAALWGVAGWGLIPVHVARPFGRTGRRSELAVLHEIARLRPHHVTEMRGIPVVRPEVLVLQMCGATYPQRAESVLDNLWRRRLVSGRSLRRTLDELAASGRNGVQLMRELLDRRGDDYVPPASNLERRFETILERACEPRMRRQVDSGADRWVGRVDFRDPDMPLIVEVQSETYHSSLVDTEHDARRLAALRAAGFTVVEVTDEQVWYRSDEVVEAVRAARRGLQRPMS
jgi:very-short-patch-repair endonuclease